MIDGLFFDPDDLPAHGPCLEAIPTDPGVIPESILKALRCPTCGRRNPCDEDDLRCWWCGHRGVFEWGSSTYAKRTPVGG